MDNPIIVKKPEMKTVFYTLGSLTLLILGLIYFENIIKPIVVAALIWFIIKELKNLLGKITIKGKKLPGFWRGFFAAIIIFLLLILTYEIISINAHQIRDEGPAYRERLENVVDRLSSVINNPQIMKNVQNGIAKINIPQILGNVVNSLTGLLSSLAVVFVYVIFLIMEESLFVNKVKVLFPNKSKQLDKLTDFFIRIDKSVRAYLSNMIVISLITAIVSYIALLILGVDFPVLWAFLIFILNFIPYIGPFISSFLPALLSVIQFGDLMEFVYVFLTLEIIQIILGNFIQPRMMGRSMNISGLAVLIALAFWGGIWGVEGMILAVPIASLVIIVLSQFPSTKALAVLLSEKGKIE